MRNLIHGVLLVYKESGCTSHDVIHKVRKLLNQKSVGHAGTLDPLAKGLLVILLGSATKLSSYFLNANKRYKLTMKFGLTTDTYDQEGQVTSRKEVSLDSKTIQKLLEQNRGDLNLPVPLFSAVKVKGKKLYSYAREQKQVERPYKKMTFYDLEVHQITSDEATVSISCSKGSYIRSWVHFLGEQSGWGCCLMDLERIHSGSFSVHSSLTLLDLENKLKEINFPDSHQLKDLGASFVLSQDALPQFPFLKLNIKNAKMLSHGRIPYYLISESQKNQIQVNKKLDSQILKVIQGQDLIALMELRPFKKMKILRNFARNR